MSVPVLGPVHSDFPFGKSGDALAPSRQAPAQAASRSSAVARFSPLYRQIKALMTESLERGEWKPGESIPSEGELALRFGVSQGTMRKAVDELAAENYVVRRQGKGTFVATHHEARAQFRFLRLAPDEGQQRQPERRILECKRVRASGDIARQLDLKSGDGVVLIRRVLLFDQVPTVLDDIWLQGAVFHGLTAERIADYNGPLYGLFETEFALAAILYFAKDLRRMVRAREKIRAVLADAGAARILGIASGSPLLSVERVSMTYGERPVELRRGLYVTTRHHYRNDLG